MTTSTVKITADVAEFVRNIKTAEGQMHMLDRGAGMLRTGVVALASSFVTAAGVGGMGALIARSMQLRDEQAKLAGRLGLTTQEIAALSLQAELTGLGADKLESSLQKMVLRLQEAAVNGGPAADAVEAIGLNIFELASKRPDAAFFAISDAMQNVTNANERLNIVADIFGEKNSTILAMLDEGRAGFDAAADATRNFGTAISSVDAAKIEAANDAFTKASESVDGLATRIGIRLSPVLQQLADNFATNTANLARFLGFRTEEEALNHLYEERKNLIEHLMRLDAVKSDDPVARQRLEQVREEIGAIMKRQQAAQNEAAERQRQQAAEQSALQKKLELDAQERELDDGKKQRLKSELELHQHLADIRLESLNEMVAEETENAAAQQSILDMKLAGLQDYNNNLWQLSQLEIQAAREKDGYIREIEEQQYEAQIARGEAAFSTMLGNVASHNKTFFKIQKLYRMSKLAMEAPAAVADAYAWGVSWGGPPAGAAMATITGAAMIAYAGQLASAQYGGGARAGSATSAGGSANSVTSPITPGATSITNPPVANQSSGSLTIIFNGPTNEQFVRDEVIPMLQDDVENRDLILIRSDSRNGQQLMQT